MKVDAEPAISRKCPSLNREDGSPSLGDIKPQTPVRSLERAAFAEVTRTFDVEAVAPVVGMSPVFIRRVCGSRKKLAAADILLLLDQDAFAETYVPRSMILGHLLSRADGPRKQSFASDEAEALRQGDARELIADLAPQSVNCVVTSTPYWGLRVYKDAAITSWADGEACAYGHEQTPEAFVRHTIEILVALTRVLTPNGSIWWNIMDSFNTRTQIRGSAAEALRAMQGKDQRTWSEHAHRRYSAGHSYLKDGEQCVIPGMIAERASRIGLYVKSIITWAKTGTLPEPQESRVSRSLEYVIHLTKSRAPVFRKKCYRALPANLGGRNNGWETDKLSDVWHLPTSSGGEGHGAQFPMALPARCIALSTIRDQVVLDPFVGSGTSAVAAKTLGRRFVGFDVSPTYLEVASRKIAQVEDAGVDEETPTER